MNMHSMGLLVSTLCLISSPSFASASNSMTQRAVMTYRVKEMDSTQELVGKITQINQDLTHLEETKSYLPLTKEKLLAARGNISLALAERSSKGEIINIDGKTQTAQSLYIQAGQDLIGRPVPSELSLLYLGLLDTWPAGAQSVDLNDRTGVPLTKALCLKRALESAFLSGNNAYLVRACHVVSDQWDWTTPLKIKGEHTLTKDDVLALITYFEPRQLPSFKAARIDSKGAEKLMPFKLPGD